LGKSFGGGWGPLYLNPRQNTFSPFKGKPSLDPGGGVWTPAPSPKPVMPRRNWSKTRTGHSRPLATLDAVAGREPDFPRPSVGPSADPEGHWRERLATCVCPKSTKVRTALARPTGGLNPRPRFNLCPVRATVPMPDLYCAACNLHRLTSKIPARERSKNCPRQEMRLANRGGTQTFLPAYADYEMDQSRKRGQRWGQGEWQLP